MRSIKFGDNYIGYRIIILPVQKYVVILLQPSFLIKRLSNECELRIVKIKFKGLL